MGEAPIPGSISVVDDDRSIRTSLERLLRSTGYRVDTYASAEAFLGGFEESRSPCVLLDLWLPGLDGRGLQDELDRRGAEVEIVFLTGHGDVRSGVEAIQRGAVDFLEKPVDDHHLLPAVEKALGRWEARRGEREAQAGIEGRYESLTSREREVLEEVVSGWLNKQIAARLGITEGTVKVHRGNVMRKMEADSLADLVRMASRLGIPRLAEA